MKGYIMKSMEENQGSYRVREGDGSHITKPTDQGLNRKILMYVKKNRT